MSNLPTSQGKVQKFADMYSWRHQLYRKLMTRIQKYLVGLKKEDKRLREEDAKKLDPFREEGRAKGEGGEELKVCKARRGGHKDVDEKDC